MRELSDAVLSFVGKFLGKQQLSFSSSAHTAVPFPPTGYINYPNLNSVLNEEGQGKIPHEFNPENFRSQQRKLVRPEALMLFFCRYTRP